MTIEIKATCHSCLIFSKLSNFLKIIKFKRVQNCESEQILVTSISAIQAEIIKGK